MPATPGEMVHLPSGAVSNDLSYGADRRRHPRQQQGWPAICIDAAGCFWNTWVVDRSAGGVGLKNCPPFQIEQVITLSLEGVGTYSCRVAWVRDGKCGLEFLPSQDALTPDAINALADMLG